MSKISALKGSISSLLTKSSPYQAGSSLVPKLDYKVLDTKLEPVKYGKERGEKSMPASDSRVSDDIELKILNTFQELCDKTSQDVNEGLASYNQRILSFDISSLMDGIRDAARSTVSDFRASAVTGLNELQNSRETVKDKFNDVRFFKEEHNIRRSATYPTSTSLYLRWALLLVLFLIESIGNSIFLSVGHLGGVFGAYAESFAIAFLNVGSALVIGRMVTPYMFCKKPKLSVLAFIALMVFLGLSGFFNLAVAHYRDLAAEGLFGEAGSIAIVKLIDAPFALKEFQSWVLFLVGWLLWIISVIDAHAMDDNIPTYGAIDRALRDARIDYANLKEAIIGDIQGFRLDGEEAVKEIRYELSEGYGQVNAVFGLRKGLLNEYEVFCEQSRRYFKQILESYRNTNISCRKEVPVCFSNELTLSILSHTDDVVSVNLDKLSEQVEAGKSILDSALDDFYKEYNDAIETFKRLDDIEQGASSSVESLHES
jgi:hypothetical protein